MKPIHSTGCVLMVALALFGLSGCSGSPKISAEPDELRKLLEGEQKWYVPLARVLKRDVQEIEELRNVLHWSNSDLSDLAKSDQARLRYLRSELAGLYFVLIDEYQEQAKDTAYVSKKSVESFGRLTALASSAVATIVVPAGTKTILSGISTGVQGLNSSVDEDFLDRQAITTIVSQIDVNRQRKREEIEILLRHKDFYDYGLSRLEQDMQEYLFSGSFIGAVVGLAKDQQGRAEKANSDLRRARQVDPPSNRPPQLLYIP